MRLKVSGSAIGKLKEFRNRIASLEGAIEQLGMNLAEEAVDLVLQGFQKQANPYGEGWAAKKHPDGRSILVGKTTNLRRGWGRRATKIGKLRWRIAPGPTAPYARYHQDGTKNKDGSVRMVARKMIPDTRGMPAEWQEAFKETATEFFRHHFKGSK
ncbi:MAG: phage virion morphogenesis protein [Bryobacteraceae bacterium]